MSSDFMSEHLLMIEREPSPGFIIAADSAEVKAATEAAWRNMRYERIGLECGTRPDKLELCRRAIASGRFHAIVLSDLSENHQAVPAVESALGTALQSFARGGGAIAVTTCDAAMALPMLQRLFGVVWAMGGYYRTTWAPARENAEGVARTFPGELATATFSAKAHAVRQVPEHERMYGTTPRSRTQSLVPFMAGREVGKREDADSVTSGAAEDYDVVVAKHAYGNGSLALFCDINMEAATVQRVLSYCRQCSLDAPPDAVASLDASTFEAALAHKAEGNGAFAAQNFASAAAAYEAALAAYDGRGGASGEQRDEKVKICSNLAECRLKLDQWERAAEAASAALALAPGHAKSLIRRAKAAESLGWAKGLSADKQREWLCDCYRMRVDDDMCWGGGFLHGLYARDDGDLISSDFLIYCKLSVKHGVVPRSWDWAAFLRTATALLPYAFEKQDAKEKWGGENVFAAVMGGRSLRATAEVVYGNSCQAMEPSAEESMALRPQDRVIVHGLTGRPELNDALGTVLWPMEPASGRYCVRVRRPDCAFCELDDVKLKPTNLRKMPLAVVDARDARDGYHAIHVAAIDGRVGVVEAQLAQGIDPDLLDEDGWTPLMRACLWAHVPVVQLLLLHGATPDVGATTTGSTALHFACMHGPRRLPPNAPYYDVMRHKLTVETLLAHGAQPGLGNAKRETAAMWARQAGAAEVLRLLEQ
ncbi:ankyrin repeat domain-containing protein 49 [Chrysochromulina tobinii]|uniref:Ankyrin repeat domain-containing protein 49 n=1 Tax=Chrysochromulina tobinii TaxID=1460289 RepID=A0A0M0JV90_9EUKA|nr:ankyrin repeat domain-containing protein 49 [Chrysochromulina tobinii]|eukprot:KOO30606.1 ankyrin repeat domain-containing protein 49 [Chrysochromulina sp. CCMP291]